MVKIRSTGMERVLMLILQEFGVLLGGLSDCEELVGVTTIVQNINLLSFII